MSKKINLLSIGQNVTIYTSTLIITFCLFLISLNILASQNTDTTKKWVGTWSCAPYAAGTNTPPSPYLANNTLRQIVRISIGGDTLRVKFSNITSSIPVTLNSVNIAASTDGSGSAIDISTIKQLKFNDDTSVTINAYSSIISDPVAFPLSPGMRLAITIYYGQCETAADMTFHYGSRTDSYILTGNQTSSDDFAGATVVERWYTINTIDVLAPDTSAAVAVLGNSITDGYGLHGGLKNKWTDKFSEKLINNSATSHVSVLNLGIGATLVTTSGVGRFQQDILEQSGLRWVIVFYGVNDIGGNVSADKIIDAYKTMIDQAHAHNIRVYGATITPFNGSSYFSSYHEAIRGDVNSWIRMPGNFDKCIDFDKIIRDPLDTTRLLEQYSNDWLHPNADGYKLLGESIDLNLFLGGDTIYPKPDMSRIESHYFESECGSVGNNWDIIKDAGVSNENYITVKSGVQSLSSAATGSDNVIDYSFIISIDSVYHVYGRLNCPTPDDDSYWVGMDNEGFVMCNGLGTSGWQWIPLQSYNLSAGSHTLSITYREDGASIDKLCVSNYSSVPIGIGSEAENICDPKIDDPDTSTVGIVLPSTSYGYSLEQNYPNPFFNKTSISFEIPEETYVSIKVFNMLGNEIAELAGKKFTKGRHALDFISSNLLNGIYYYTIFTSHFTDSRVMVLKSI